MERACPAGAVAFLFDFVEAPSLTLTESVVVPLVNSHASTVVVTTSVTVSV